LNADGSAKNATTWSVYGNVEKVPASGAEGWTLEQQDPLHDMAIGSLSFAGELGFCTIDVTDLGSIFVAICRNTTIRSQKNIASFTMVPIVQQVQIGFSNSNIEAGGTIDRMVLRDVYEFNDVCHVQAKAILQYSRWAKKEEPVKNAEYPKDQPLDSYGKFSVLIV
jgi:hypothetical protein